MPQHCRICIVNDREDPKGAQSRIDAQLLKRAGLTVIRTHTSLDHPSAVADFFQQRPDSQLLIHHSHYGFALYQPSLKATPLGAFNLEGTIAGIDRLAILLNYPTINLSLDRGERSYDFIALLFNQIVLDSLEPDYFRAAALPRALELASAASSLPGGWRSNVHKGYAKFIKGNLYLLTLLSQPTYQKSLVNCAQESYQAALKNLYHPTVAEFNLIVQNNLLVARFIEARLGGRSKLISKVTRQARNLIKLISADTNISLQKSLISNLVEFEEALRQV
jgi:hypothetical protein